MYITGLCMNICVHYDFYNRLGVIKNVIVINYNLITFFKVTECSCNWTLS